MARTPSASAHEKVLEAAIRLIGERGIEGTSMDAISQASGVSKATVYKHWKNKDALCIDVVKRLRLAPPEFHSGDPRRDLLDLLTHVANAKRPRRLMWTMARVISYAATHPGFGREFQRSITGPAETQVVRILNDAISRGELSPRAETGAAMSLLFGPIWHRRMTTGTIPPGMAEQIVDAYWRSWSANP
jgi:AcrR family transcriptional regulator